MDFEIRIYEKKDKNYLKGIELSQIDTFYIKDQEFVIIMFCNTIYRYDLNLFEIVIK